MEQLKPCPFCGGKAHFKRNGISAEDITSCRFDYKICCTKCGATSPGAYGYIAANLSASGEINIWHDDRDDAIAAWNRRANEVVNDYHDLVKDLVKEGEL